jgi:hypothetical protein
MAEKKLLNATDCANRAGKFAFGLDESKAVQLLRGLADDLEAGRVMLQSVSTACHATQDEFVVRELVIEMLEDSPEATAGPPQGPHIIMKT